MRCRVGGACPSLSGRWLGSSLARSGPIFRRLQLKRGSAWTWSGRLGPAGCTGRSRCKSSIADLFSLSLPPSHQHLSPFTSLRPNCGHAVIEEALRAARRVNDYSTAVRIFEGLSASVPPPPPYLFHQDGVLLQAFEIWCGLKLNLTFFRFAPLPPRAVFRLPLTFSLYPPLALVGTSSVYRGED